jgi:hypothetical protein
LAAFFVARVGLCPSGLLRGRSITFAHCVRYGGSASIPLAKNAFAKKRATENISRIVKKAYLSEKI